MGALGKERDSGDAAACTSAATPLSFRFPQSKDFTGPHLYIANFNAEVDALLRVLDALPVAGKGSYTLHTSSGRTQDDAAAGGSREAGAAAKHVFVTFGSTEQAVAVLQALYGQPQPLLGERVLTVRFAEMRPPKVLE
jgi:hypothetical protein